MRKYGNSIPKIIHYCWFGSKEKPKNVNDMVNSWKEKLPDYIFIEWNESNFDINICLYTKHAYESKKYAFVSDYARLFGLYHYGGVYLDTDVEVRKDFSELLSEGDVILGFEEFDYIATSTIISKKESPFIEEFMNEYHSHKFIKEDGTLDTTTNVYRLTNKLDSFGLLRNDKAQEIEVNDEQIKIMPKSYFSPLDYGNYIDNSNDDTYTVHHYSQTWIKKGPTYYLKKVIIAIIGGKKLKNLRNFLGG